MMRKRLMQSTTVPALAAGIFLLAINEGRAESYRDDAHHFTLQLPEGWGRMPPDALAAANASGQDWPVPKSDFLAGFHRTTPARAGSPIILLQFEPERLEGKSLEEIERKWSRDSQRVARLGEGLVANGRSSLSVEPVVIDRDAKRLTLRVRMDVPGAPPLACYTVGTIGKRGIVLLHCYTAEAEFAQWLPELIAIADSVHFDSGYEFGPQPAGSDGRGIFVFVGCLIPIVAVVWLALRKLGGLLHRPSPSVSGHPPDSPDPGAAE
jgi:hypothetical protein